MDRDSATRGEVLLALLPLLLGVLGLVLAYVMPDDTPSGYAAQTVMSSAFPWLMAAWPFWGLGMLHFRMVPVSVGCVSLAGVGLAGCPPLLPGPRIAGAYVVAADVNADGNRTDAMVAHLASIEADAIITFEQRGGRIPGMIPIASSDEGTPPERAATVHCRADLEPGRCTAQISTPIGSQTRPMPVALLRMDTVCVLGAHAPAPYPHSPTDTRDYVLAIAERINNGQLAAAWGPCQAGDPVVVSGNLNAAPGSPLLRALRATGLRDRLRFTGVHTTSWPGGGDFVAFPMIRLDHLLAAPAARADYVERVYVPGSDHRGLLIHLRAKSQVPMRKTRSPGG
ncbi:MAG: endonuclease/exonuclease/phosphatase family protein [Myxococcota bacterium]